MSLGAANGSTSIYGTPSRSERLPFPQSSNASPAHILQRQPGSSGATSASHSTSFSTTSTSTVSAPPVNKDRPLTVAYLLKANATAQDPKLAALEHAVNDRNVLSSQNAQLWKLIEKQRAGYNQILKELERVRAERDAYKVKINGSARGEEKRHRINDTDRAAKRSISESIHSTAEDRASSNGDPRQTPLPHPSDDQSTPRNAHHPQLHLSRSHEPLSPRDNTLQLAPNSSASRSQTLPVLSVAPASSSTTIHSANLTPNSRLVKPSPTPLIVPPRAENLPIPASAISATQETNPFSQSAHHYPAVNSSDSLSTGPNDPMNLPPTRPLATYPRKSSLTDSVGSNTSTGTGANGSFSTSTPTSSTSSPYTPPSQQYHYSGGMTPQTAPAGFGNQPFDTHQSIPRTATTPVIQSQPYPQILTTPSSAPNVPQSSVPPSSQSSNGMLSTIPEGRPPVFSRDSRISLPEEAKHYIANMTDSPIPSPKVDAFASKSSTSFRVPQPQLQIPENPGGLAPPTAASLGEADSPGASSEFLDMNEDDDDDDEEDEDEDADDEESAAPEAEDQMGNASFQETPRQLTQTVPQLDIPHLQAHGRQKPRVVVESFPLPPQNAIQTSEEMNMAQTYTVSASEPVHQHTEPPPAYVSAEQLSPLENPYSPPGQSQQPLQPLRLDPNPNQQPIVQSVPANFRELPLLHSDLPSTVVTVSHSFVRPNDRGKEVLSFIVYVDPGNGKEGWKVEKMYSDVLALDQRVRNAVGKGMGKKIASLPEGKLWKDHAPAKVDQRKAVLEQYLQQLVNLPVKENIEVIAFFTSDIVRETKQPVMQVGHKEGYLTKRGKNFGGWKTRYFVLQGPILEYYDCRGGAHLGSILVTGAQIGRQQRSERAPSTDEEKEYRHAFLIVEAKKGPGGNHPRHVLCAESDEDRDAWVEILVRYFTGIYSEEPLKYGPAPATVYQNGAPGVGQPRSSTSSIAESPTTRRPTRGFSKDDISISKGAAVPISQLPPDQGNAKLFPPPAKTNEDYTRSSSPSKHSESPIDSQSTAARRLMERGQPSSLPDSSPLSSVSNFHSDSSVGAGQRANSELGHYQDLSGRSVRQVSPERHRSRDPHDKHKSFHPTLNTVISSPTVAVSPVDRVPSPEKIEANAKVKISGPLNGAPIPSGFKFGKETPTESNVADRRLKSRSFWGFGKPNGSDKTSQVTYVPRAVFGVTLDDSLDVAQIANLPAIVFRCIQYLEAKKAEQEEGIYRLSGSSAVIKSLKDRFNMEGDVDLLASDEYWDPHAIAGLLKSFLRELPASILTRDLHLRFLSVIDFVDAQERIKELSRLIAALPLANYSLLRALTAHLILIVQNAGLNKMTMRNVGIVFSPTLGIPAGVFSLMLGEFNRVFNVDAEAMESESNTEDGERDGSVVDRRNSKHYSDAAADQLLGLAGRTLKAPEQEPPSDGDDMSAQEESGAETTDGDNTLESSSESGQGSMSVQVDGRVRVTPPDTPLASKTKMSKASAAAATRGLNVNVTGAERGNRHSKLIGLPTSPRPTQTSSSPSRPPDVPPSPSHARKD